MSDCEDDKSVCTGKKGNSLPIWGNEKTMNLNPLILTNIQSSQYFKVKLYQLKTYHEVIDELYYQVAHLEPWERGSRKTSGQTGMCGGVRGVGAGGIVSTAFCILYKLYTLRLTRKQVMGLLNHSDSPYIRGLGFMYIRYTQPPADLWDWFEPYLDDPEEIDVRSGGGQTTTIGQMVYQMLSKLDWYSTLFPRIPVPIQKDLESKLASRCGAKYSASSNDRYRDETSVNTSRGPTCSSEVNNQNVRQRDTDRTRGDDRQRERNGNSRDRERRWSPSRSQEHKHGSRSREYSSRVDRRDERRNRDFADDLRREKGRIHDFKRDRSHDRRRSRSRSRDRKRKDYNRH